MPVDSARVLLVEDSAPQIFIVRKLMDDIANLELMHVAKDGQQALEFLSNPVKDATADFPDLMLLDINMPHMDGFELLEKMKSDPALRSLPVTMFTSSSSQEDVDKSFALGASGYITKPLGLEELEVALRDFASYWARTSELPTSPPALPDADPNNGNAHAGSTPWLE